MHAHTLTNLPHLQVAYIWRRRWRQMGKLQQRVEQGHFWEPGPINTAKSIKKWIGEGCKETRSQWAERHARTLLSLSPAMEQQTFPQLVNCGGIGRRVCLFLINPFLNYRADGKRTTASARISPNEPPPFLSPASCLLTSFPVCLGLLLLAAPVSVSLVRFQISANQIQGKL